MKRYMRLCAGLIACSTLVTVVLLSREVATRQRKIVPHNHTMADLIITANITRREDAPNQQQIPDKKEIETTNTDPCVYGSWGPWSSCSAICGDPEFKGFGTTERHRNLLLGAEKRCNTLHQKKECDCDAGCALGPWGDWGGCSDRCGFATQRRSRKPQNPFSPQCHATPLTLQQARHCHLTPCDPAAGPVFVHENVSNINQTHTLDTNNTNINTHTNTNALLQCGDHLQLNYTDATPFARGYTKEVWRATLGSKVVVVKKPIARAHMTRFTKGIVWEDKWLTQLGASKYMMKYYGSCSNKKLSPFEVVEGGLTKWDQVMWSKAPWCLRVRMAMEATEIVEFLHNSSVVHCDWKYDQVAVDPLGHVKLVDVKSVRWLLPNKKPYRSDKTCTPATAVSTCFKCMKILNLTYDHTCINHKCVGYDVRSLITATAQSFYQPLLVDWLVDAPDTDFTVQIQTLISKCNTTLADDRWTLPQIHAFFENLMERFDGARCFETKKDEIIQTIANSYKKMLDERNERCQNRYC